MLKPLRSVNLSGTGSPNYAGHMKPKTIVKRAKGTARQIKRKQSNIFRASDKYYKPFGGH